MSNPETFAGIVAKLDHIIEMLDTRLPPPPVARGSERDLYTVSHQLGLPAEGEEHVAFCTLPPNHPPGCGITASGAMHPESDAAKRYREMRS